MKRSTRMTVVGIAAGVLLAGAGAAVALDGNEGTPKATTHAATTAPTPTEVPRAIATSFGVFREAPTAADAVGADLASRLRTLGANPSLARVVHRSVDARASTYVVPARDGMLCVLDGTASGGCLTAEHAIERGTVGTDECPRDLPDDFVNVHGLVPDGVESVDLRFFDGRIETEKVHSNLWSVDVPRDDRPEVVSWTRDGSRQVTTIPYSPDVKEPC